ncbi:helix-turn-helix domain-containing protein [Pseudomonas juntendi]|uniref:Helix-turn-helix domain-containing protein n=1 Tax=Pseudomonas juntendi TaxID=2666183 RepID=A0ABD4YC19_9PSED|nr:MULTISPECIES: helix-turn-helix domain-containing protein [Pseudomonas]MDH0756183.1 helix-turn-helix domain-containing protein [Pseudomonas juntendi]MDH1919867.1 helix-turn-helix domain-containing protein [Pseudomonas juntendi]RRV65064.1 helix-turn-helix domain-containing protein [Pseudomonas sp. p99-361]SUD79724.1 AraC family transcriptional regulator [Pseudomonas putida]
MFAETRSFNDPQLHAGSIIGWDQTYDQVGRGVLSTELTQVCGSRFQIFHEVLDKRVVQQGCAPKGRLCVAVAMAAPRPPVMQGHQVASSGVALLRDGEEFVLHAPEQMHFLAANLDIVRFAQHAAVELSDQQITRVKTSSQVLVSTAALQRLCFRVFALVGEPGGMRQAVPEQQIENMLLEALLDLFHDAQDEVRCRRGNMSVSAYLVKRSQEIMLGRPDQPLSILDICGQLRVSRRTLQYSFQQITGLRPVEYLRNVRLNAVRRALLNSSLEESNVSEVAGRMGFFHLSHFAAHYRELFGEPPSATRRRSH